MRFSTASSTAVLAASLPYAFAQTYTKCDPLEKTCPPDTGLPESNFNTDFTQGSSPSWSTAAYSTLKYGPDGAEFSIDAAKQAPTISTDFYIFFGRIDVKMKAAKGTGIVSSIVFESDDLDEIDWEILGGNTTTVETNFFGKGNTTAYDRAIYYPVSDPQEEFHTYTIDWNSDRIEWIIDGTTVRTVGYDDPLCIGGKNYPQTPMKLKLGNWCGGCQGEPQGTVTWAGGRTSFDDAPYIMYVESVTIQNANPAEKYEWTNESGDWQSIKIVNNGKSSPPSGHGSGSHTTISGEHGAPTHSVSVSKVHNTGAVVSKTVSGKPYPTNSSSVSSETHKHTGGTGGGSGSVATSSVLVTTHVPGSQPTGGQGLGGSPGGTGAGTGAGTSASASASGNHVPATGGASSNAVVASTSLLGLFLSLLLL